MDAELNFKLTINTFHLKKKSEEEKKLLILGKKTGWKMVLRNH